MFWTTSLFLVALTFGQVLAGVVKPEIFIDDATNEVPTASGRIVSGWEASRGQFPYIASLRLVTVAGAVITCAGSVVQNNWILTAAHCTNRHLYVTVRAGTIDLTSTPEYISETREVWMHPSFAVDGPGVQQYDIALLRLQQPITYSTQIQPIRIQSSADAYKDYADEQVTASGWGRRTPTSAVLSTLLHWVYLRAISNQECASIYGSSVFDEHICTRGYNVTTQSTCFGDNGSPLVHEGLDGVPVLVGIAIFWRSPDCTTRPAGFIRPGPFHSWLTEVTELDFETLNGENEATEAPTTAATDPPTTEVTELPTSEVTAPSTIEGTEPPTYETTEPSTEPTTMEAPEPDSEDSDENSNESSSESKEDPEVSGLVNKLQVNVKVKVKINNNVKS